MQYSLQFIPSRWFLCKRRGAGNRGYTSRFWSAPRSGAVDGARGQNRNVRVNPGHLRSTAALPRRTPRRWRVQRAGSATPRGFGLIDNAPNSPKMEHMKILPRIIESRVRQALERQMSVLLLGPRQTGKTTLLEPLQPDLLLNFLRPEVRQRYERAPRDRTFSLLPSLDSRLNQKLNRNLNR